MVWESGNFEGRGLLQHAAHLGNLVTERWVYLFYYRIHFMHLRGVLIRSWRGPWPSKKLFLQNKTDLRLCICGEGGGHRQNKTPPL